MALVLASAMKTVLYIVLLIFFSNVSLFALNIAWLPGALIAGKSNKCQSMFPIDGPFGPLEAGLRSVLRFIVGVIVSMLGQSYVYLAFVAAIVSFTRSAVHGGGVFGPVLWPMAFVTSFTPINRCAAAAIGEARAGSGWNVQVCAIAPTEVLASIGFFIFVFFPSVIALGWPYIPFQ